MIFLRRFKRYIPNRKVIYYDRDRQNNKAYLICINSLVMIDILQTIGITIIRYHSFKIRLRSNDEYRAIYYYPYGRKKYTHIKLEIIDDRLNRYDFATYLGEW
jgi:hypothetical protein